MAGRRATSEPGHRADLVRAALWPGKAYAAASLLPAGPPSHVVVVTEGRAGSEALITRLSSHPGIICDSEILGDPRRWPERLVEGRARLARSRGAAAYGFKVLGGQVLDGQPGLADPCGFVRRLAAAGWLVVHLSRRNRVHQAISALRALATSYHYEVGEAPPFRPMHVDPDRLLRALDVYERAARASDALLQGVDPLRLVYEDDLEHEADQARTVGHLVSRLGLSPAPTSTRQVRVHPSSLDAMVTNGDELVARLRGGRYEHHLDGRRSVGPGPAPDLPG